MTNEVAVVVGASGAIGTTITAELVNSRLTVIGVGRDGAALAAMEVAHGEHFRGCIADISRDDSIEIIRNHLVERTVAMVVHAPGVPVAGGVKSVATEALVAACNVKVAGLLRLVRACEQAFRPGSRIVAIGGHYGFEPSPYAATAGVANAALANMVRQLSWAFGSSGVTSHLLAPGPADTDRLRQVLRDRAALNGTRIEEEVAAMRADSALGALTEPRQVAWAVKMLLAPEADALAGSSLMLDAGRRRGLP